MSSVRAKASLAWFTFLFPFSSCIPLSRHAASHFSLFLSTSRFPDSPCNSTQPSLVVFPSLRRIRPRACTRLRGRFGEGGPGDVGGGGKRGEKGAARVTADESLSAVSANLDKLTRMLETCLSPVSRVNFASLYAPLSFSAHPFSPHLRCIDIAEVSRISPPRVR